MASGKNQKAGRNKPPQRLRDSKRSAPVEGVVQGQVRTDPPHVEMSRDRVVKKKTDFFRYKIQPTLPETVFEYPDRKVLPLLVGVSTALTVAVLALYAAFVFSLIGGLVYYLVAGLGPVREAAGPYLVLRLAIYVGLLFIGAAILLFLVKPFIVSAHQSRKRIIKREEEPLLFEFIDRIATRAGSKVPDEVRVSQLKKTRLVCEKNRLVLILGLPQIMTWNIQQFAAALSSIYGNYSQISKHSNLRRLYRAVQWWQACAEQYDAVDLRIYRGLKSTNRSQSVYSSGENSKITAVVYWFCVEATRKVFQLFYYLTRLSCAPLMRQVSRSTASLTTSLVGAAGVASYLRNECCQQRCYTGALYQMLASKAANSEANDYAKIFAFVRNNSRFPDAEIDRIIQEGKTRKIDFRDCARVQIENAADAADAADSGRVVNQSLSTVLFFKFDAYSQLSTIDMMSAVRSWDWKYVAEWGLAKI